MSERSSARSFEYEPNRSDPRIGNWILLGVILLIIGAFVFLRSEPTDIGSPDELATLLTNGQPKVLEFYSNF